MKNTYLIHKDHYNNDNTLIVATTEEWHNIVAKNKDLPKNRRRYFIADYIMEGKDIDCMVIEVSQEEHRRWCREHNPEYRNLQYKKLYSFLSMDAVSDAEVSDDSLNSFLETEEDLVDLVIGDYVIEQLRTKLQTWEPWAEDMLDLYLAGRKHKCASLLSAKYGVTMRTIQNYMRMFESFVKKFFK